MNQYRHEQTDSEYHIKLERWCVNGVWWQYLERSNRKYYCFPWRQYGVPIQRWNRNQRIIIKPGRKDARLFCAWKYVKILFANDNRGYRLIAKAIVCFYTKNFTPLLWGEILHCIITDTLIVEAMLTVVKSLIYNFSKWEKFQIA